MNKWDSGDWFFASIFVGIGLFFLVIFLALVLIPEPTDNIMRQLDACNKMWYTVDASWEGDTGSMVIECR